jgi:hypothetical protein
MPIKKRTSLPPKPFVKHRRPSTVEPYKLPGRPLTEILRELDRKVSDLEWEQTDHASAIDYKRQADDIRKRIEAGELYEVDF